MKPDKKPSPKKPNGRVFDISRPGKAPASPTSRPVIMGHKAEAQDAQAAVSGVGQSRPLLTKRKIEITPADGAENVGTKSPVTEATPTEKSARKLLSAQPTQEEKDALATTALDAVTGPPPVGPEVPVAPEAPAAATPKLERSAKRRIEPLSEQKPEPGLNLEPKPESQPETKPEPDASEPKLSEELPADTSSVPAAEQADADTDTALLPKEEEEAPEPIIEPLFDDSGAIVVSHHDHHRRHQGWKIFGLLTLILLLAAITLNLLLDLGILTLETIPHIDLL